MLSQSTYQRIIRASAWYDLAISWPYMAPITLAGMWLGLDQLHETTGFAPMPELTAYGVLFANFFGTVVIIWSLVRLRLNDPKLGRYDAAGRVLFSAWMVVALLNGASPFLYVFLVIEISFGILQALPVRDGKMPVMQKAVPAH